MTINARPMLILALLMLFVLGGCTSNEGTPQPIAQQPVSSPTPPPIPSGLPVSVTPSATITGTLPATTTGVPSLTPTDSGTATTTPDPSITPTITLTPTITPLPGRTATATLSNANQTATVEATLTNQPTAEASQTAQPTATPTDIPTSQPNGNLLNNPSFENGTTSWVVSNTNAVSVNPDRTFPPAQDGQVVLLVNGGEISAVTTSQTVGVSGSSGDTLRMTGYQQGLQLNAPECTIRLSASNGSTEVTAATTSTFSGSQGTWEQFQLEITPNAAYDRATVTISCSGGTQGQLRGFDNFDLRLNP